MRAPLDVVLSDSAGVANQLHIADLVRDFGMDATSPGGYGPTTLSLDKAILSDVLLQYDTLGVYDRNSGAQVGGGRLVVPGKSAQRSGEVWHLQAIGEGPAHAQDMAVPRVYVETSLDGFYQRQRNGAAGQFNVGGSPDGDPPTAADAVNLSVAGGGVASGLMASATHERLADCGMQLGGVGYRQFAGQAAAGWKNEVAVFGQDGSPALSTLASTSWATGAATIGPFVVGTDFTAGADVVRLAIRRTGVATNVADDTSWGSFYNVFVVARRKLADGTDEANANHANGYVLASEVVADLVGRDLTRFAATQVDVTSQHIDQLSYLDGANPQQILDDLLKIESAYTWHVWNRNSAGLYEFEWVAWPTSVRYECGIGDGFESPAPTDDRYAAVNVRYKDAKGRTRWTTRTQTVTGIQRTAMLDLSDESGSLANANRAGDRFLADHMSPPNSGTLTVARDILDKTTGRMVKPWEIRPGNLVRVRGVRPYPDALNATDRDGVTVFRVVSRSFSDSAGSATLELDSHVDDETREIARLANRRPRRR